MKQSLKTYLFIIIIIPFLWGCEYEISGEYNQNILQPKDSFPAELTLSLDKDSIMIYENTNIKFSLDGFGLKVNGIEFKYLGGTISYQNTTSGSFTITPDFKNKGWFDLTAKFYLSTGTGSIADMLKAENYVGSKTWKIKFVDVRDFKIDLKQHINKDSLVELYWIKPKNLPLINSVISITTMSNHPINPTRINGDTTFFALDSYCAGSISYSLYVQALTNVYLYSEIEIDYPYPDVFVEQHGPDSCRIYCKSDRRLNYYFDCYLLPKASFWGKTSFSFTVEIPYFGFGQYATVYFKPISDKFIEKNNSYSNGKTIVCTLGKSIPFSIAYCKDKDILIYFDEETQWNKYKTFTFPLPENYKGIGITRGMTHNYANNSGSIILNMSARVIFRNGNPNYEPFKSGVSVYNAINNVQIVDGDCIGFSYVDLALPTYKLINYGDNVSWSEMTFNPDVTNSNSNIFASNLALTQNGKYLCSIGATSLTIYDLSDHKTPKEVFITPVNNYLRVIPNPNQPNQVILQTDRGIELRSCPNFELLGQFIDTESKSIIPINVDPYSNILLGWSSTIFHFYNISTMKEVLRINGPSSQYNNDARLLRNHIINESRAMDLTKYLK